LRHGRLGVLAGRDFFCGILARAGHLGELKAVRNGRRAQ
jgi:hypothetical protein